MHELVYCVQYMSGYTVQYYCWLRCLVKLMACHRSVPPSAPSPLHLTHTLPQICSPFCTFPTPSHPYPATDLFPLPHLPHSISPIPCHRSVPPSAPSPLHLTHTLPQICSPFRTFPTPPHPHPATYCIVRHDIVPES